MAKNEGPGDNGFHNVSFDRTEVEEEYDHADGHDANLLEETKVEEKEQVFFFIGICPGTASIGLCPGAARWQATAAITIRRSSLCFTSS